MQAEEQHPLPFKVSDIMRNTPLDLYDDMPKYMRRYISNYGWHFNKESLEYAVGKMRKKDGGTVPLADRESVLQVLQRHGVTLENDTLYDGVYVYHQCLADLYGSSIADEKHLALYVKDIVDDADAPPDAVFRKWVASQVGLGQPVPWSDLT